MTAKRILLFGLRLVALTVAYFVCFTLAASLTLPPITTSQLPPEQVTATTLALLAVGCLNSLVLAYIILRSRWNDWRLIAAVCFSFYGANTFMPQLETLIFPAVSQRMPPGMLTGLFVMGLLFAALYALLATLILGRLHPRPTTDEPNLRLVMPVGEWAWKLALIATAYVTLYMTFGYFIAWSSPAVRTYHNGADHGSFFLHMANLINETPWLIFFQLLRGLLWALVALPVVRMMQGGIGETMLAVGLLFAVVMNAGLLVPNPFMPEEVRMVHLVETASSNFIFGCLVGWLLSRSHTTPRPMLREAH